MYSFIFSTGRLRRWDFRIVPAERSLEAMGVLPGLHIISSSRLFDLFPRMSAVEKMAILRSKWQWICFRERTD